MCGSQWPSHKLPLPERTTSNGRYSLSFRRHVAGGCAARMQRAEALRISRRHCTSPGASFLRLSLAIGVAVLVIALGALQLVVATDCSIVP